MNAPSVAKRIMVVEDESTMADVVARYLRRDGHDVRVSADGLAALEELRAFRPDLVVLDLMLPGLDGLEVCRRIRADGPTPVIILTARGDEVDRLVGFGVGADDYVTKPFSPRELAARVQAVLRRALPQQLSSDGEALLEFGALTIAPRTREVRNGGRAVTLTAREFDLLYFLASQPRQVFSRDRLLARVWDEATEAEPATVTVHIRRVRAKLEVDPSRPRYLKTVWGVGYKFEP